MECPSVQISSAEGGFVHEPCAASKCHWWENKKCSAVSTVPVGNLTKKLKCALAPRCRWAHQSIGGVCPPMTHGTLCEHQGGDFNTFDFEEYGHELSGEVA